ncbi:MAG: tetratricopeptide repeat protein [Myxococcales bacterium]|nr:tetratricopeptide repeat protein [Myxococcales bacterium]
MVARDGRARVMDFGLARSEAGRAEETTVAQVVDDASLDATLTRTGALLGTPAYMAPEQHQGLEADARTDQFSFCVALWRALYREPPFLGETLFELRSAVISGVLHEPSRAPAVPSWLRAVVARGLAVEPSSRWSSMPALLDALSRGQLRTRRLRLAYAFGAIALLVGGGLGWRALAERRALASCAEEGARVAELWPGRAEEVRRGALGTGLGFAESSIEKSSAWLDDWAEAWSDSRARLCRAWRVERSASDEHHARATMCLELRRATVASFLDRLAAGEPMAVQQSISAFARLPSPRECTDQAWLERTPWPDASRWDEVNGLRARLATLQATRAAADFERGLRDAAEILRDAEALGWPPLVAFARHQHGVLLEDNGRYEDAATALERAYFDAASVDIKELAADTATHLAGVTGRRLARFDEGRRWGEHARVYVTRLDELEQLRGATLALNLAGLERRAGNYVSALDHARRAVAVSQDALGARHPGTASSLSSLGTIYMKLGDDEATRSAFHDALAALNEAYGPSHPTVASVLNNQGAYALSRGELDETLRLWTEARDIRERAFGPEHPDVAESYSNLGVLYSTRGDYERAIEHWRRALAIEERALGSGHQNVGMTVDNIGYALRSLGRLPEALEHHQRALEIFTATLGPQHETTATARSSIGEVYLDLGEHARAVAPLAEAVAIVERAVGAEHVTIGTYLAPLGDAYLAAGEVDQALATFERAVAILDAADGVQEYGARARSGLARALLRSGGARSRALAEANRARTIWRRDGPPRELARVEAWLAEVEP